MKASRRIFLQNSVMATLAVSAAPLSLWADEQDRTAAEEIGDETLRTATASTFEQWIGGKFTVKLSGVAKGTLVLDRVESQTLPKPKTEADSFGSEALPRHAVTGVSVRETEFIYLQFKRAGQRLEQETYTLNHGELGTFDLLLVPSAQHAGPSTCTAILGKFTGKTALA